MENLKERVNNLSWWHRINLGDGIITPGTHDPSPERLRDDYSGCSVLDVGAWDGFYSFEAKKRGADRVLALDKFAWVRERNGHMGQDGFNLAREALGLNVEDVYMDIEDATPENTGGPFDVVFFFGVLYHLPDPFLAIKKVAALTRDELLVETHCDCLSYDYPAMRFYPGAELAEDVSNWWGPNPAAVVDMLRCAGFDIIEQVYEHKNPGTDQARSLFRARK